MILSYYMRIILTIILTLFSFIFLKKAHILTRKKYNEHYIKNPKKNISWAAKTSVRDLTLVPFSLICFIAPIFIPITFFFNHEYKLFSKFQLAFFIVIFLISIFVSLTSIIFIIFDFYIAEMPTKRLLFNYLKLSCNKLYQLIMNEKSISFQNLNSTYLSRETEIIYWRFISSFKNPTTPKELDELFDAIFNFYKRRKDRFFLPVVENTIYEIHYKNYFNIKEFKLYIKKDLKTYYKREIEKYRDNLFT
ncbi:hypothetical protein [Mycoplasmopsis felis]|uniref:hypothetical protein n=2 Tax=Mycoplasmopsis felis TaxID=33923 RepID=UPI002AFFADAE|nr:hypothetical protein [Mycoplasmopsis felis]WQQ08341.1 hypothetical protein RRG61_03390 [Mycoplasmopsis felis]